MLDVMLIYVKWKDYAGYADKLLWMPHDVGASLWIGNDLTYQEPPLIL